jgi:lipoprotein-releasing system permease protein
MKLPLHVMIAKALLLARWRQTLVAAIGVTFSIGLFITLLGFMSGLNDLLDGLILNRTPHIRIYNEVKPSQNQPVLRSGDYKDHYNIIRSVKSTNSRMSVYNSATIMDVVRNDKRVFGVAPKIVTQVFFNEGSVDVAAMINGIDVHSENRLFHFSDYITEGKESDLMNVSNSIILGKPLADMLLAHTGDVVQLTMVNGERFPLKVVGYFQSGYQDFDKTQSYASIGTVQKLLGVSKNYITDIQVKLNDIEQAPALARYYSRLFNVDAEDIQTANSQFSTGSFIRTLISYTVGITLLIVAGFGIYNILNMMIYEKMDSIAILKATGFSGRDVKTIFLMISLTIGVFGGVLGLLTGLMLSGIIDQIPFDTAALPTIKTYPIRYSPVFYTIGIVFSLVTTYFAGWFPARKASRVDPVIIIRGK